MKVGATDGVSDSHTPSSLVLVNAASEMNEGERVIELQTNIWEDMIVILL